jgi:putative DNA primase/helicase
MTWENYDDVLTQLQDASLILDRTLTFDARIQRWKVENEDKEKRGWSRLREWTSNSGKTYIVGVYGVWHGNDDGKQSVSLKKDLQSTLTDDDRKAMREAHKEAEKRVADIRKAEVKRAAGWAAAVWNKCEPCEAHEYLVRKQIQPHGLRILQQYVDDMKPDGMDDSNFFRLKVAAGALVVPMHDAKGAIQGLQFIYAKGHSRRTKIERDKEFWPSGMAMGGTFGLIGAVKREGILLIAEGYATAATLHECAGQSVAYAFSANNLSKAGKQLAKEYPRLRILFCADDDYLTDGNPGCTAAADACAAIERSAWIKPNFLDDAGVDRREGKKLTDFNDLLCLTGLTVAVADQVNTKLDEHKWRDQPATGAPSAGVTQQGGGERAKLKSMLTIDEGLERFALVYGGKSTLFDFQEHILVPKADVLDIIPEHGWRDMRSTKKVVRMDEVGFDPAGMDRRITCNLWGGWPTTAKQGSCDRLLELLEYLCSNDENYRDLFNWVIRWLAFPIQHPGAKMQTALVVQGPQGTGKNLFFEAYKGIYGEYGRIIDQDAVEDKFNDWASKKLFMIADEVVARAELYHAKNKLKGIVTGTSIRINPKNVSAHDEVNHVNLVFLSNEYQPLVLEDDDRRYTVIKTPEKLTAEFYREVRDEIDSGGIEALHWHLLQLELGDFNEHSKPPMTQAKADLIEVSQDSVKRFILEWQREEAGVPFVPCLGSHLYTTYKRWCDHTGERSPRSQAQFLGTVKNLPRWRAGQPLDTFETLNSDTKKGRKMVIPPDDLLKTSANFVEKGEKTQAVWLTECFFKFALAGEFEC